MKRRDPILSSRQPPGLHVAPAAIAAALPSPRPRLLKDTLPALAGMMLLAVFLLFSFSALAQTSPPYGAPPPLPSNGDPPVITLDYQGNICPGPGFVERIVGCIKGIVYWATTMFLMPFSHYMALTVRTLCTLAVIFFGIEIALGKRRRLTASTMQLGLKFGFIIVFTWNFGGMFPWILYSMDWLVNTVMGYTLLSQTLQCPFSINVWQRIDCAIDRVLGGILPGSSLATGLLGMLVGSIFSGPMGLAICLTGLVFVGVVFYAIAKSVYIFLSAYIGICLMVIVSPLFVPLILFKVTKGYFEKWLRLLLGLILQPIFLFAYLSMLLAAFDVVIFSGPRSLYATIAGPSVNLSGFRVGRYVTDMNAYTQAQKLPMGVNLNPKELASSMGAPQLRQTGMMGQLSQRANDLAQEKLIQIENNFAVSTMIDAVDYSRLQAVGCPGCSGTDYLIRILMALIMAVVVAYIFYIMLQMVPYLGTMLSGEVMSIPNLGKGFDDKMSGFGKNLGGFGKGGEGEEGGGARRPQGGVGQRGGGPMRGGE